MDLFKVTTWKWWELKVIAWGALLLGMSIGIYFVEYLKNSLWLIFGGFVVMWLYVAYAWYRK